MKTLIGLAVMFSGLAAAQTIYQDRGMGDIALSGSATIPHSSPSDAVGIVQSQFGFFVTRGLDLGGGVIALFQNDASNVFVDGGGRYFFGAATSRARPFVGAGVGTSVVTISGSSDSKLLAAGSVGFRYFFARHVAMEVAYEFVWVHIPGASLRDSSESLITVGFAHVFGR